MEPGSCRHTRPQHGSSHEAGTRRPDPPCPRRAVTSQIPTSNSEELLTVRDLSAEAVQGHLGAARMINARAGPSATNRPRAKDRSRRLDGHSCQPRVGTESPGFARRPVDAPRGQPHSSGPSSRRDRWRPARSWAASGSGATRTVAELTIPAAGWSGFRRGDPRCGEAWAGSTIVRPLVLEERPIGNCQNWTDLTSTAAIGDLLAPGPAGRFGIPIGRAVRVGQWPRPSLPCVAGGPGQGGRPHDHEIIQWPRCVNASVIQTTMGRARHRVR